MSTFDLTTVTPEGADFRAERGKAIAQHLRLKRDSRGWLVPSQTTTGTFYRVNTEADECSCLDYETRAIRCKHQWAVTFVQSERTDADGSVTVTRALRVTYRQDWASYNAAQTHEHERFLPLLRELCDGIPQPPQSMGRPRIPLSEVVFALGVQTYSMLSGRRAASFVREAAEKGFLEAVPSYNSMFRYLESPEMTDVLKRLIEESAKPLAAVESQFAIDSTGIGTTTYRRWFDHKWGRERSTQTWVKVHAMTGTHTNVVTAIHATADESADSPQLPALLARTAEAFDVRELSADRAYSSKSNLHAIEAIGAKGFIPFKQGSTGGQTHHKFDALWSRMWFYYQYRREEFLSHYHARSNAETTFAMVKRKFGASVRAKTPVAQVNEALLKFLAHNIVVVIASTYELGIEPEF